MVPSSPSTVDTPARLFDSISSIQSVSRDALRDAAGSTLVVNAAGVIGNFEWRVRIADAAGIPLERGRRSAIY